MCRSIKTLRQRETIASEEEIRAAALQYVRKISGFREPSQRHQAAFDEAVTEVTAASRKALRRISRRLAAART